MRVKGEPAAVGTQAHEAEVPEIVTAPETPHVVIAEPLALKVTVPVCPEPTVAEIVIVVPASRGDDGETLIDSVEACLVIVKLADLLAEYQFASPAFCATIVHVPEDFWAVTVSPRVPESTQSALLVEKVMAPFPVPPEAVKAVATPYTREPFENVGVAPAPLLTSRYQLAPVKDP